MSNQVYVVTCPEMGWDCVVAVYNSDQVTLPDIKALFPSPEYVVTEMNVDIEVEEY